jgi:DNA-binding transcriptional LysR family regulator
MDIHQIEYLITIADNDFNLTKSAHVLHVSQPALSKFVTELEQIEQLHVFSRHKGRLTGLTRLGKDLVRNGQKVLDDYNEMMSSVHNFDDPQKGTVKVGIAPVIISTLFNRAIPKFIQSNPGINLKIIEKGAYELQKLLILQEIDLAVLVSPATFPSINEEVIYKNYVDVWFNKNHRFHSIPGPIPIEEVGREKIVTLDDSFMVTFQTKNLFKKNNIKPDIFFQTGSWDLLLNMCQEMNVVGIIAAPIGSNYSGTNIEHRYFKSPFPWNITICTLGNDYHNNAVNYTQRWFSDYFKSTNNLNFTVR